MVTHFSPAHKLSVLLLAASTLQAQSAANGLGPGARLPELSLTDQNGMTLTFKDLRGPKGVMLVFYRSADW